GQSPAIELLFASALSQPFASQSARCAVSCHSCSETLPAECLPGPDFRVILKTFSMPDRAYLHPIDPELVPGARNAINVCLRLKPQERIKTMTDTATREIAAALQKEVERVGSEYSLFVLEHHARRPLKY